MKDSDKEERKLTNSQQRYSDFANDVVDPIGLWMDLLRHLDAATVPDRFGLYPTIKQDVVIPPHLANYLLLVALRLEILAEGRDPRIEEPPNVDLGKFKTVSDFVASAEFNRMVSESVSIDAEASKQLVPLALGLTRASGWSAFASHRANRAKLEELQLYDQLRSEGLSAADAVQQVQARHGIKSERQSRKRLAEARDLLAAKRSNPQG